LTWNHGFSCTVLTSDKNIGNTTSIKTTRCVRLWIVHWKQRS